MRRFQPAMLAIASLLALPALALSAQILPHELGPIVRGADDPAFVGAWRAVDEPSGSLTIYIHYPDGRLLQTHGSLEAARYSVVGDSVRFEGGYGELVEPERAPLEYRIRGDSLWLGRDELAQIRIVEPEGADDPLEGQWTYQRHGKSFVVEFTRDGRYIRWIVAPGPRYELLADTLVTQQRGTSR